MQRALRVLRQSSLFVVALVLCLAHQGTDAFYLSAAAPKSALARNPATLRGKMRKMGEGEGPRLRSVANTAAPSEPDLDLKDDKPESAKTMPGPLLLVSGLWRRGELFARSAAVFWTAAKLFLDYKILQWRTVCALTRAGRK